MSNGFGHDMAQKEIESLLEETEEKKKEAPKKSHCEDHDHQQRVNYALLLGMSALLKQRRKTWWISSLATGITAGIIIGIIKAIGAL